ncbi:MAG: hypothetical protein M3O15_13805 [Acidobacteriota bacterium]|nr:hypothetical protein [Acidobacteriota bacterium]
MSPAPNDLFAAAAAKDGGVYTATRNGASGTWSAFTRISTLDPRYRNLTVAVTPEQQVCTFNNAGIGQLLYTYGPPGWSAPLRLASGVSPARAAAGSGALSLAALALGRPTLAAQYSFGLPLYTVDADQKTVHDNGDQLANIDPGPVTPTHRAGRFAMSGTFDGAAFGFHLCLVATPPSFGSELYYAFGDSTSRGQFVEVYGLAGLVDVSCSPSRDEGLHVCVIDHAGAIRHVIRSAAGTWTPLGDIGDVSAATHTGEKFTQIAISHYDLPGSGGILHLVGITSMGRLLYTNRTSEDTADPVWAPFADLTGGLGAVRSADIGAHP